MKHAMMFIKAMQRTKGYVTTLLKGMHRKNGICNGMQQGSYAVLVKLPYRERKQYEQYEKMVDDIFMDNNIFDILILMSSNFINKATGKLSMPLKESLTLYKQMVRLSATTEAKDEYIINAVAGEQASGGRAFVYCQYDDQAVRISRKLEKQGIDNVCIKHTYKAREQHARTANARHKGMAVVATTPPKYANEGEFTVAIIASATGSGSTIKKICPAVKNGSDGTRHLIDVVAADTIDEWLARKRWCDLRMNINFVQNKGYNGIDK